jgi:hypothetical protein
MCLLQQLRRLMLPSWLQDTLFVNDSSGALLVTANNGMPQIFKRGAVKPLEEFGSYRHKMWPVRRCACGLLGLL